MTLASSTAPSCKTTLMSFLFLNLKIIFFHDQGFARGNWQRLQKRIRIHRAYVPSDLKRPVGLLSQLNFTLIRQLFFEREPVFLRDIRGVKQFGNFTDLRRATDHCNRFPVASSI